LKLVLDTCVLKLATFPRLDNPAALIVKLGWDGLAECWASPAILDEYSVVLASEPELLALIHDRFEVCYPLTELDCIRHEPDNRFIECAFAISADFLITVNTARGHFDQKYYGATRVVTPGEFLNLPAIQPLWGRI
jgi:predicted nucleic acid-binding protein